MVWLRRAVILFFLTSACNDVVEYSLIPFLSRF
jgi:hypothetical protein